MTASPEGTVSRDRLSEGCVLCHQGAKMVLFITGTCDRDCWYCPLSLERKDLDAIYANEREVFSPDEAVGVAETMEALGTGITGGEPLLVRDRVVAYARALKERFGPDHHIHLYTGRAPSEEDLAALEGLVDEIRMHPPVDEWRTVSGSEYDKALERGHAHGFEIGFEIPSLPGLEAFLPLIPQTDVFNINELEWGETCSDAMRERGLFTEDDLHSAIDGAKDWALPLLSVPEVHWCSSRFKDGVQLRMRLIRIAERTCRPFDEVTDEGTVVYGAWEPEGDWSSRIAGIPADQREVCGPLVEMSWEYLSDHAGDLPGRKCIVERYPDRGMIVEVIPVGDSGIPVSVV